jgi:hypothetical protein
MAADLAALPRTGVHVQLCGDAHVRNLGAYAAPDGHLLFDINDFRETIRGPFEWDLKRLTTSVVSAGREAGARDAASGNAVEELVSSFRTWIDGVRLLRPSAAEDLMEKIELDLVHDAHLRPHQGLGGATPAEIYLGRTPAHLSAIPPPRGGRAKARWIHRSGSSTSMPNRFCRYSFEKLPKGRSPRGKRRSTCVRPDASW